MGQIAGGIALQGGSLVSVVDRVLVEHHQEVQGRGLLLEEAIRIRKHDHDAERR